MIACTLLKGINDSDEHADELAKFVKPIEGVAGKVRIDERRLERSDSKSIKPHIHITNNLPFVAHRRSYSISYRTMT